MNTLVHSIRQTAAVDVQPQQDEPVNAELCVSPSNSAIGLVELMLKAPQVLDSQLRDVGRLPVVIPQLLLITLAGFTLFCVTAITALNVVPFWPAFVPAASWSNGSWLALLAAYDFGLLLATGVCLPSFYFYTLLAGVRVSMTEVVAHALKGHAVAAIVLVGILPAYVAALLGLIVFGAPDFWINITLMLVLVLLPIQAGFAGARSLYYGFMMLEDTMPAHFRCRRQCFLRRLLLAWCGITAVVTPVMIYTLWVYLASWFV